MPETAASPAGAPPARGETSAGAGGGPLAGYGGGSMPLGSYAQLIGLYNLAFAVFLVAAKQSGRRLPERLRLSEVALLGLATFKLSRLLGKDLVTTPLRAPFARFEGMSGEGEVKEKARGQGMQRAVGELLTCPFCLGPWVAAFLAYAFVLSPRAARLVTGLMAASAIADFLQLGFGAGAEGVKRLETPEG